MVYKYSLIKSLRLNYSRATPDKITQEPNGKIWERIPQLMRSHNLWGLKVKNQSIDE